MAPEQLEAKEVDARADIFAFGAVLYEVITGRKRVRGDESRDALISAILSSEPPALSVLQPLTPPALERVIRTCLAKDRNQRWTSVHDVLLQLELDRPGWIGRGRPRRRQREEARDSLAWTVAAGAVLTGVVLWGWSAPTPDTGRAHARAVRVAAPGCVARHGRGASHLARRPAAGVRWARRRWQATALHACFRHGHVRGAAGEHRWCLVALLVTEQPIDRLLRPGQAQDGSTWKRDRSRRSPTRGAPEAAPGTRTTSSCSCHVPRPVCTAFPRREARPRP